MTKIEPRKTVLVVEDDADVRDAISLALSMENFLVQSAESREMALDVLAAGAPTIIMLDWFMPGMTIEDFVSKVSLRYPQTAIVMISASLMLREKARELGVRYFLSKPFNISDLLAIANACTSSSKR